MKKSKTEPINSNQWHFWSTPFKNVTIWQQKKLLTNQKLFERIIRDGNLTLKAPQFLNELTTKNHLSSTHKKLAKVWFLWEALFFSFLQNCLKLFNFLKSFLCLHCSFNRKIDKKLCWFQFLFLFSWVLIHWMCNVH